AGEQTPLERLLRPDGTLDLATGFSGSLDPAGWQMETGPDGAPRFVPAGGTAGGAERPAAAATPGDEYWDNRFTVPGTLQGVLAVAVMTATGEVYIGGNFTTVDD